MTYSHYRHRVDLATMAAKVSEMDPGDRIVVPGYGFRTLWADPVWPEPDDHIATPKERAERWADQRGCDVWERLDPPGLVVEKRR